MQDTQPIHDLTQLDHARYKSWPFNQDICLTCALCASACPASGIDALDPRSLVRQVGYGLEDALVAERWPWICTMCAKCEHVCPMDIQIADMVRNLRGLRDRQNVPGILQQGLEAALETGNNLRLPQEDFVFIVEDVGEELAEEAGFENFKVALDKDGANLLTTIHNKLVNTHTEDLKHFWKIFHAAGESWTLPTDNWEGTNWGYFTGDDEAMKTMVGRIVANLDKLNITHLLLPE